MAINPGLLPNDSAPISDARGLAMQEWRDFFLLLASQTENDEFAAELNALAERVEELEDADTSDFTIIGVGSVQVQGSVAGGMVQLTLAGDANSPGNTFVYGTNADGEKGWHLLGDSFDTTTLARTVDPTTGVVSYDLAELADTGIGAALVKLTRDGYGRVEGTEAATTDDLIEGVTNLYFPEAPIDGTPYARQDAGWVPAGGGGILPMVTGEVYLDQPRFMYFDDGSLMSAQVE